MDFSTSRVPGPSVEKPLRVRESPGADDRGARPAVWRMRYRYTPPMVARRGRRSGRANWRQDPLASEASDGRGCASSSWAQAENFWPATRACRGSSADSIAPRAVVTQAQNPTEASAILSSSHRRACSRVRHMENWIWQSREGNSAARAQLQAARHDRHRGPRRTGSSCSRHRREVARRRHHAAHDLSVEAGQEHEGEPEAQRSRHEQPDQDAGPARPGRVLDIGHHGHVARVARTAACARAAPT